MIIQHCLIYFLSTYYEIEVSCVSSINYLLRIFYVPGTALGDRDTEMITSRLGLRTSLLIETSSSQPA